MLKTLLAIFKISFEILTIKKKQIILSLILENFQYLKYLWDADI